MIVIVDTNNIAARAYHTTRTIDSMGMPCGMVDGTLQLLAKVFEKIQASSSEPIIKIATFDHGKCHWRRDLYPEYKKTRAPKLSDFIPQLERLETVLRAMGFHVVKSLGVEADDIIGVLASHFETNYEDKVVVVTSDKDLWQLISPQVLMYDMHTGGFVDPIRAEEILGFPSDRIVEYKALVGDTSDNIKGAKGIGEKTAKQLLQEYPDVQELVQKVRESAPDKGVLKKIADSVDDIMVAGKICTVAREMDDIQSEEAKLVIKDCLDKVAHGIVTADYPYVESLLSITNTNVEKVCNLY